MHNHRFFTYPIDFNQEIENYVNDNRLFLNDISLFYWNLWYGRGKNPLFTIHIGENIWSTEWLLYRGDAEYLKFVRDGNIIIVEHKLNDVCPTFPVAVWDRRNQNY